MTLIEKKILESERNSVYVKSTEGSRLTGTVTQNKDAFDRYPELIRAKFNELIDFLVACGLDNLVADLTNRYTKDEADALVDAETKSLVADVGVNLETGAITITKKDGSSEVIDTALEKVPATFEFEENLEGDKFYLKVTNVDGTTTRTEVTNLMNQYTFQSGTTVTFTAIKSGTTTMVTAEVKGGSIGFDHLSAEVRNYLDGLTLDIAMQIAEIEAKKVEILDASATVTANVVLVQTALGETVTAATEAKSYAKGGTGSRTGEDTDNSYHYSRQAALYAQEAANYREECKEIAGGEIVTLSTYNAHAGDNVSHVTADDRVRWDSKMDNTDIDCGDWDGGTMYAMHQTDEYAHENLSVDGNE